MRFGLAGVLLMVSVLVMGVPGAAQAQPPLLRDTWLATGFLGMGLDADADPSLTIGGAVAYPITDRLAIEGELGHVFDTAPGDADVDSSLTTFHGSLLYFFSTSYVLTPYVIGGIGFSKFSHDVVVPPGEFNATEVGFNVGAGVTYPLGEGRDGPWYFRGEFRLLNHIDDVPSIWRFTGGLTVRLGS